MQFIKRLNVQQYTPTEESNSIVKIVGQSVNHKQPSHLYYRYVQRTLLQTYCCDRIYVLSFKPWLIVRTYFPHEIGGKAQDKEIVEWQVCMRMRDTTNTTTFQPYSPKRILFL